MNDSEPAPARYGARDVARVGVGGGRTSPWPLPGFISTLLAPAEGLFRVAVRIRDLAYNKGLIRSQDAPIPVISVGNLTVGGTGKTPFCRKLVEDLRGRGTRPAVVHGGYGADEPALHRLWNPDIPVTVGADRTRAIREAVEAGAEIAVLDDGFQHRRLARDLDLVLVAAETWDDRPRLLPRGPWREPPRALRRADAAVITRRTASQDEARRVGAVIQNRYGVPTLGVRLEATRWRPVGGTTAPGPTGAVVAVAALAEPEAFLDNARAAGADITDSALFRDHHEYTDAEIRDLIELADGRPLVTTEKDWVKLAASEPPSMGWVLLQHAVVEWGDDVLDAGIRRTLQIAQTRGSR